MTETDITNFNTELQNRYNALNEEWKKLEKAQKRKLFKTQTGRDNNKETQKKVKDVMDAIKELQVAISAGDPSHRKTPAEQTAALDKLKKLEKDYNFDGSTSIIRISEDVANSKKAGNSLINTLKAHHNYGVYKLVDKKTARKSRLRKLLVALSPVILFGVMNVFGLVALGTVVVNTGFWAITMTSAVRWAYHEVQAGIRKGILKNTPGKTYEELYPTQSEIKGNMFTRFFNKLRHNYSMRKSVGKEYDELHLSPAYAAATFTPGTPALATDAQITNAINNAKTVDLTNVVLLNACKTTLDGLNVTGSPHKDEVELCQKYINLAIAINNGAITATEEAALTDMLNIAGKSDSYKNLLAQLAPKMETLINNKGVTPGTTAAFNTYRAAIATPTPPVVGANFNTELNNIFNDLKANFNDANIQRLDALLSGNPSLKGANITLLSMLTAYKNSVAKINTSTLDADFYKNLRTILDAKKIGKGGKTNPKVDFLREGLVKKLNSLAKSRGIDTIDRLAARKAAERNAQAGVGYTGLSASATAVINGMRSFDFGYFSDLTVAKSNIDNMWDSFKELNRDRNSKDPIIKAEVERFQNHLRIYEKMVEFLDTNGSLQQAVDAINPADSYDSTKYDKFYTVYGTILFYAHANRVYKSQTDNKVKIIKGKDGKTFAKDALNEAINIGLVAATPTLTATYLTKIQVLLHNYELAKSASLTATNGYAEFASKAR